MMDRKQEEFLKELLADFRVEAREHQQVMIQGLLALENQLGEEPDKGIIEQVFREMHSMKGAARAVNLLDIERLCQGAESLLQGLKEEKLELSAEMLDSLLKVIDTLEEMVSCIDDPDKKVGEHQIKTHLHRLDSFKQPSIKLPDIPKETPPKVEIPPPGKFKEEEKSLESVSPSTLSAEPRIPNESTETVRIQISRLNKIFEQAEEFLAAKSSLNNFIKALQDIPAPDESLFQVYNEMSQFERSFSRLIDNFIGDIKTTLLYPFSSILDRIPKMVRDLSRQFGKEISLSITGEETEIDRRILEELKDPLNHLIRNCIDHGLETPEERKKEGKKTKGTLTIQVRQDTNQQVVITIEDDGRGINKQKLLDVSIKQGMITQEEARKLKDKEIYALIFRSGISTSPFITDLSGRGLGMAIVAEKVARQGGSIVVDSETGKGTKFIITLPLTLSTFHGIPVKVHDEIFIFPTNTIVQAIRILPEMIRSVEGRAAVEFYGEMIGVVFLGDLVQIPNSQLQKAAGGYFHALILEHAHQKIACIVDGIQGEVEGIVKDIQPMIGRINQIAGVSILGNGQIVPVLNTPEVIENALQEKRLAGWSTASQEEEEAPPVIVVAEDSLTARSLIKNVLESEGYRVFTAVDGEKAFQLIKEEAVDLVVSDVEMPNMNGFELTARIRAEEPTKDLPVILVTALESADDRQRGLEAGANAYINKSSFEQQNLLETIHRLI